MAVAEKGRGGATGIGALSPNAEFETTDFADCTDQVESTRTLTDCSDLRPIPPHQFNLYNLWVIHLSRNLGLKLHPNGFQIFVPCKIGWH